MVRLATLTAVVMILSMPFVDCRKTVIPTVARFDGATPADILNEINMARTNPHKYARVLEQRRRYYQGALYSPPGQTPIETKEGIAALDEAIAFLKSTSPRPKLSANPILARAAGEYVADAGPNGIIGHIGSDGVDFATRIKRYSNAEGDFGENIAYGLCATAEDIVVQLLVDDGIPGRGHRINLLRPTYRKVGIAVGPHSIYHGMCVQVLAEQV